MTWQHISPEVAVKGPASVVDGTDMLWNDSDPDWLKVDRL